MALVGPTLLAADPDTSNVASYATPSVSPTAGALIEVDVWNTHASAAALPSSVSAAFATVAGFTQVPGCDVVAGTGARRVSRWVGVASGTPGSGAVTVAFAAAQTGCIIVVCQYTGQHATTPVLQGTATEAGGAGATSISISLGGALQAATSIMDAGIGHNVNEDQTAGSGSTELSGSDVGYATPTARFGTYTKVNATTVSASWATSGAKLAMACEIVAAPSGTALTLDLNDTITVSDAVGAVDQTLKPQDTTTLSDQIALASAWQAVLADTATLSDQVVQALATLQQDTVVLSDLATIEVVQQQLLADSVALTDQIAFVQALQTSLADSVTLSDQFSAVSALQAALADSVALSDQFTPSLGQQNLLTDVATLSDQIAFVQAWQLSLADGVTLSDFFDAILSGAPEPERSYLDRGAIVNTFIVGDGTVVGEHPIFYPDKAQLLLGGRAYEPVVLNDLEQAAPGKAVLTLKGQPFVYYSSSAITFGKPTLLLLGEPYVAPIPVILVLGKPSLVLRSKAFSLVLSSAPILGKPVLYLRGKAMGAAIPGLIPAVPIDAPLVITDEEDLSLVLSPEQSLSLVGTVVGTHTLTPANEDEMDLVPTVEEFR